MTRLEDSFRMLVGGEPKPGHSIGAPVTTHDLVEAICRASADEVRDVVAALRRAYPELWPERARRLVIVNGGACDSSRGG